MSAKVFDHYSSSPALSIIVVNYNNPCVTIDCLEKTLSSLQGSGIFYEIVVVDNCSSDNSFSLLTSYCASHPYLKFVLSPHNGGFGFGCNVGALHSSGSCLWFLNSDAWIVALDGFAYILELLSAPTTGLIGTSVLDERMVPTPQSGSSMSFASIFLASLRIGYIYRSMPPALRLIANKLLSNLPIFSRYIIAQKHDKLCVPHLVVPAVGGASLLVAKTTFLSIGMFDEGFFLYDEDGDLCLRSTAHSYQNLLVPSVVVATINHSSVAKLPSFRLKLIKRRSRLYFISKHFSGFEKIVLLLMTNITFLFL